MDIGHLFGVCLGVAIYYVSVHFFWTPQGGEISFDQLPKELQAWRQMGDVEMIHGREMFYIYQKCLDAKIKNPPTFVIIHGFPSSSYEYHKVLRKLAMYGDILINDHIGFGFSETPLVNYTYSLGEHAENVLALWRRLGIQNAHIVSHDMGDSVLTEILARRHRKMLPSYFDEFFHSVTFTNGGMNIKMINFRITQRILMYPSIGKVLGVLARFLGLQERVFKQQIGSIWGPVSDATKRDRDIDHMFLLNAYNNEINNGHNTICYLWDRYHFEFRWFDALEHLDIPARFIWSDSDSVSPISIPEFFRNMVPDFKLAIIKNRGHFWMLEDPDRWVQEIVKAIN